MLVKYDDDENHEDCFIDESFSSLRENAHMANYITKRAILTTTNDNVDMLNEKRIEMSREESKTYSVLNMQWMITQNYYQ